MLLLSIIFCSFVRGKSCRVSTTQNTATGNYSSVISYNTGIWLCSYLYNQWRVEQLYWCNLFGAQYRDGKVKKESIIVYFMDMHFRKRVWKYSCSPRSLRSMWYSFETHLELKSLLYCRAQCKISKRLDNWYVRPEIILKQKNKQLKLFKKSVDYFYQTSTVNPAVLWTCSDSLGGAPPISLREA